MKPISIFAFRHIVSATSTLIAIFLITQPARCQPSYTIGDYGGGLWTGSGLTGIGISSPNTDATLGQTFFIHNVNALVNNISFPLYDNSTVEFQVGVAAWNGSQPAGSLLYLSNPLFGTGTGGWQSFTVTPNNLVLNQGQEYVLFLTPNAFVNTSLAYDTFAGYVPPSNYPDGQGYNLVGYELTVNDLFNQSWHAAGADVAFSLTYQAVPEPAAPLLLCLGGLALWWRKRIRP